MPNSCRSIIKRLRHNGAITQAEFDKLMRKLDGWIPVNEGLPEDGERVLVTYDKIVIRATWDLMRYRFYDTHAASLDKDFIYAWMPLPEPYEPESEENDD